MSRSKKITRAAAFAAAAIMMLTAGACGGEEKPKTSDSENPSASTSDNKDAGASPEESSVTMKTTTAPAVTTTTTTTLAPLPVLDEYKETVEKNSDLIGWIRVPGTPIDYAVAQFLDNSFYLSHGYDKEELRNGIPFIDWQCQFTTRTRPANIIIYGHNMMEGPSFAKVTTYCPWYQKNINKAGNGYSLKQYTENPVIYFNTVWDKTGSYKVFAGMFTNTQEEHGEVFYYYRQRTIANEGEFYDYIGKIMDRSQFYTDVDLEYGDELLTLSTCYYPFGQNVDTRFVLFARRVREGESEEVDISKAYINKDPLYFDYWYKVYGGSWGGRTWDTSKVKGFDEYYKAHETTGAAETTTAATTTA